MANPSLESLGAELGLKIQLFEPFHNLSPEAQGSHIEPNLFWHESAHGLRLYLGDALALLRQSRGEMFDLIFADPPYFLSNNGITCQNGQMVSVNKGDWDKAATFEEIHAFNLQWLRECRRLLKPNGAIWVSGTSHNIFSVGYAMQTLGFKILNDIAWHKVNPPPNLACRYFTHATETLIWARRDPKSRHVFHYDVMKQDNGNKQMQSLWHITPPGKNEKRYGKHPTQKPEALLDRIVRATTNPGDLVLDPFCGSGTTGVLCARLGRRFVGFDKEEIYLNLARHRIESEVSAPRLFSCAREHFAVAAPWKKHSISWRLLIANALRDLGGEAHLKQIYQHLEMHPRTFGCPTWPATVRRTIREGRGLIALGKGRYKIEVNENQARSYMERCGC